jgi:hypothetical protein
MADENYFGRHSEFLRLKLSSLIFVIVVLPITSRTVFSSTVPTLSTCRLLLWSTPFEHVEFVTWNIHVFGLSVDNSEMFQHYGFRNSVLTATVWAGVAQSIQWLDYGLNVRGSIAARGRDSFSSAPRSRPALGPTQPTIQWIAGDFTPGWSGRGFKLTTHLHLLPRSRMRGAAPPFRHTSSWRGAQLSSGDLYSG